MRTITIQMTMKMISQFTVRIDYYHVNVKLLNYTVNILDYLLSECPGLAEWDSGMEVKNPLFTEETPAATIKNEKAQPIKASK